MAIFPLNTLGLSEEADSILDCREALILIFIFDRCDNVSGIE